MDRKSKFFEADKALESLYWQNGVDIVESLAQRIDREMRERREARREKRDGRKFEEPKEQFKEPWKNRR